jgi:bifunctional non-homologous end joining protein LigD
MNTSRQEDGETVSNRQVGYGLVFGVPKSLSIYLVRPPIVFYAFDLLRLNGQDLRSRPIEERKSKLAALLKNPPPAIRCSASFTENIDELLSRVRELSLEGLIGKRAGSKYNSKRSGAWIKIKLYQQGSFVISGYTQPAGERNHMGALLVGVYQEGKLKYAGKVGTGFSEKLLQALSIELNKIAVKACPFYNLPATGRGLDPGLTAAEMKRCVWVKPSIVCEVKFTDWTRDDRLRQPIFLGSCSVPRDFVRPRTTNLAVTAAQIFEFADEGFCQAQVPLLGRFLCAGSSQCASPTLLLKAGMPQGK